MTFKVQLTTLTPVHIGNGVKYKANIEVFREGEYIYFIDPVKIYNILGKKGINKWTEFIINDNKESLKNFLEFLNINDIEKITKKKCFLVNSSFNKKIKDVHEQYFNPLIGPCIPGSSIKGAIKTALFYYISEYNFNLLNLNDLKDTSKKKVTWTSEVADKKFFGDEANFKSTKFLKVGDASFEKVETKIYPLIALNAKDDADKGNWEFNGKIANFYEAIPDNSKTVFQFSIDEQILELNKKFKSDKWKDIKTDFLSKELINIVNESYKSIVKKEYKTFKNLEIDKIAKNFLETYEKILEEFERLSNNEFILRIGGCVGYNFITLRWFDQLPFFKPIETNTNYKELRKLIQNKSRTNKIHKENNWPRTRKIVTDGTLLGFIKLRILDENEYLKLINEEITGSKIHTNPEKIGYENNKITSIFEEKLHKIPQPYKGKLAQGISKIPAVVIKSGKPNLIRLLIENNETEINLSGYASEIKEGTYIYVRLTEYSKGQIKRVNYDSEYK